MVFYPLSYFYKDGSFCFGLSSESPCEKFTSMLERPHKEDAQSCDKENLCEPCLQSLGLSLGCFWVNSSLFPSDWPRHQRNIIKGPHTTKALKRRRITQLSSVESLSNQIVAYENLALNGITPSKTQGTVSEEGQKECKNQERRTMELCPKHWHGHPTHKTRELWFSPKNCTRWILSTSHHDWGRITRSPNSP